VATPTPKLGRFRQEILEPDGDIVATATVRRNPAGAYLLDDAAPTNTVSVYDIGAIRVPTAVEIAGGTQQILKIVDITGIERSDTWTVSAVNVTATPPTVTLGGVAPAAITGSGNKHPRLVIVSPIPTTYGDPTGIATGSNPATSDGTSGGTSGIVADYLRAGAYDVKVLSTDATYIYYYDIIVPLVTGGLAFDVTDVRFGAKGDNSANDGPAINKALVEAGRTATATNTGAVVWLPPGLYLTTESIEVPDNVDLVGQSMHSAIIKAQTGVTSYLVRVGGASGVARGCRVHGVYLDATAVSGIIGLTVPSAPNINTVIRHCGISTTSNHAISMGSTTAGADWTISDCLLTATGAFSAVLTNGDMNFTVRECLMSNAGSAVAAGMVAVVGGSGTCLSVEGSGWADLFKLTSAAVVNVIGCRYTTGGTSTTNVVNIATGCYANVIGCLKGAATNLVMNNATPSTDANGFYLMGVSGAILSSLTSLVATTPIPQTFSGGLTSSGTTTLAVVNASGLVTLSGGVTSAALQPAIVNRLLSPSESVVAAATISVTKNTVLLTGAAPITISTIQIDAGAPTSAHDGYQVMFVNAGSATFSFDQTGNILVSGGAGDTDITSGATTPQTATFRYLHNLTGSKWLQVAPKAAH
jgi:hypothetical protein